MSVQSEMLDDLRQRHGKPSIGGSQTWLVERNGGKIIIPTAFEPDPVTCRDEYYYNAVTNILYKRVITRQQHGILSAHWQKVSE